MTGDPLTDEQIGLIRRWIDDGAAWPEDSVVAADPEKKHWPTSSGPTLTS